MGRLVTYVSALFLVFIILILLRIVLSYLPRPYSGPWRSVYEFICQSTDWYLNLFRRFIPPLGMLDLSPMVALIVLYIVRSMVVNLLG
ncbi:MAG: YggT family protein [Thermoleophilia bacterium]